MIIRKKRYFVFSIILAIWIYLLNQTISYDRGLTLVIFPSKQFIILENIEFILTSVTVAFIGLLLGITEIKHTFSDMRRIFRKLSPYLIIILASITVFIIPITYAHIFEHKGQSLSQTIIDLDFLNEDFEEHMPGSYPENWYPLDGNWTLVDDGGNIVYYQQDNSDKEALSISTIGNTNWINYTFQLELKFIERNSKKDDAGALLLFRYQGSNNYYYLWMKEYQNQLELYNHGAEGVGQAVSTTSCNLVPETLYHINITIKGDMVNVSINNLPYFTDINMHGAYEFGSIAVGTRYYKIMFDNIIVEPI